MHIIYKNDILNFGIMYRAEIVAVPMGEDEYDKSNVILWETRTDKLGALGPLSIEPESLRKIFKFKLESNEPCLDLNEFMK